MSEAKFSRREFLGTAAFGIAALGLGGCGAFGGDRSFRVLVGQMHHESSSFVRERTTLEDFRRSGLLKGQAAIDRVPDPNTVHGPAQGAFAGIVHRARELGNIELRPTITARYVPAGPLTKETFDFITLHILDGAASEGPVDAVVLALHGAMVAEGYADADGYLLSELRKIVGDRVPIIATMDKHANVSELSVRSADMILADEHEPHIDRYERGREAIERAVQILTGEIRPVSARVQPPMILPAINMATQDEGGPMERLMARAYESRAIPGVITANVQGGFYGADVYHAGLTTLVTTNDDIELARALAEELAEMAWSLRHDFLVPLVPLEEAVRQALEAEEVVLLVDEADDPAGGSYGDIPAIFAEMLRQGVTRGGVATIRDPETVLQAYDTGLNGSFAASIGGKLDRRFGHPVEVEARVLQLHEDGLPRSGGRRGTGAGRVAVLDTRGIVVIVTEYKIVTENENPFEPLGYDVREWQALTAKGLGLHMRKPRAYGGTVNKYLPVDSPGPTTPNLKQIGTYENLRRPIFPIDLD